MTVQELIAALQTQPPLLDVITEGCDCYGDAHHVELDERADGDWKVVICREPDPRTEGGTQ